jgi:general secretion pathway protein C
MSVLGALTLRQGEEIRYICGIDRWHGSRFKRIWKRDMLPLEVLLKRYFAGVVGGAVALAAYFQGAGISYLLAGAIAPAEGPRVVPPPNLGAVVLTVPSVTAIRDRNPFDSVTGPLHDKPEPPPEEKKEIEVTDPLGVGPCAGVQVFILTESDDPLWSFAAVQGPGETGPSLKRVGDAVGSQKVAFIGFNPRTNRPALWLEGDGLCQASLFGEAPPPAPAQAAAPVEAAPVAAAEGDRGMDPELKKKIKKISETDFEIDRSAVDKILDNQADLMKSARIVPEQKDGKIVGVRMFGIRPETLLGQLGMTNGDRLETINGFDMGSPEKALEAYARLRTAGNLTVTVNRRGKPVVINYKIQ